MRTVGAVAGLVPAAMALAATAFLVGTEYASPTSTVDLALGSLAVIGFAVAVGWLVEPSTTGSIADDVAAGGSYVIAGCLVYLAIATIGSVALEAVGGSLTDPFEAVVAIGFRFGYGLLFSPMLAAVLAPFAVGWVVAVRLLRRSRGGPGSLAPVELLA